MEETFSNEAIIISDLPEAESVDWIPLSPNYKKAAVIGNTIAAFIVCGGFLAINLLNPSWIKIAHLEWVILAFLLLFFAFLIVMSILGFKQKAYAIREHDVLYKSGLIFRKSIAIPFNRIQHNDISQGPIAKYFGLSTLSIYTAGGSQSDLSIAGLATETAKNIKAFITEKTAAL